MSSFSSKHPSIICTEILRSELGQLCLSSASCLPVRLQQLVAPDEGWKTIGEGLFIPVCVIPGTALHPGTSRWVLEAGGSNCQLPLTLPESGSQDPHTSSEVPAPARKHPLRRPESLLPAPAVPAASRQCPLLRSLSLMCIPIQNSGFWRPQQLFSPSPWAPSCSLQRLSLC